MQNNISRMVMLRNIFLEIKLAELLPLKQASNVCIVYHNNYFTCTVLLTLTKYPHKRKWRDMERALRGGVGGGVREGFSDKLSGWADIGGTAKIQIISFCEYFVSLFALSLLINEPILFF